MGTNVIFRPKGIAYNLIVCLAYIILVGLTLAIGIGIIEGNYIFILFFVILMILLILQTRDVIRYKMRLTDTKIFLGTNRLFGVITRQKKVELSYDGIRAIQYYFGLQEAGFMSVIVLFYENDRTEYLDVLCFSYNQVNKIIEKIKLIAQENNSYQIEVKPEEIQKGFERKRKK